jgi:hypothetical protein
MLPDRDTPTRRILDWAIAVLLGPAFLFNCATLYILAAQPPQAPWGGQPSSLDLALSFAFSSALSTLALISSLLYWTAFRRREAFRISVPVVLTLGLFPLILALSRVLLVVIGVIACFATPGCGLL